MWVSLLKAYRSPALLSAFVMLAIVLTGCVSNPGSESIDISPDYVEPKASSPNTSRFNGFMGYFTVLYSIDGRKLYPLPEGFEAANLLTPWKPLITEEMSRDFYIEEGTYCLLFANPQFFLQFPFKIEAGKHYNTRQYLSSYFDPAWLLGGGLLGAQPRRGDIFIIDIDRYALVEDQHLDEQQSKYMVQSSDLVIKRTDKGLDVTKTNVPEQYFQDCPLHSVRRYDNTVQYVDNLTLFNRNTGISFPPIFKRK